MYANEAINRTIIGSTQAMNAKCARQSNVEAAVERLQRVTNALDNSSVVLEKRLSAVLRSCPPNAMLDKPTPKEVVVPLAERINELCGQAEAAHRRLDSILERIEI